MFIKKGCLPPEHNSNKVIPAQKLSSSRKLKLLLLYLLDLLYYPFHFKY